MYALLYNFLGLAAAIQGFRILDSLIKMNKPYYAVHVIHNLAIVALTAPDVIDAFNFVESDINWIAIILCYALHIYHIIDYHTVFRFDDWIHHGLMLGLVLPAGCISVPNVGALIGANLFFTTGLPGAISYGLLFAERNTLITRPRTQAINKVVHLWIRAPGCVAQATLAVVYMLNMDSPIFFYVIPALTAWNGLYFMEQAIRSEGQVQ